MRSLPLTALGWTVAGLGVVAGGTGWWFGWRELVVLGGAAMCTLVLAAGYLFGGAAGDLTVTVRPDRLRAGDPPGECELVVQHRGRRSTAGVTVEVPVGIGDERTVHVIAVPRLAGRAFGAPTLPVPAERRGVVAIGPATSVRADPLGLMRRVLTRSTVYEVPVHPRTVRIDSTGAGLLRDLEGQATRELSASDVAFHALREYVAGDDLRHVHPLTSARLRRLMVRQFVDTRTAHLAIVVSGAVEEYRDADEFEVALSVAGSLALRSIDDCQRVSVVAAGHAVAASTRRARREILDGLSRATFGGTGADLGTLATHTRRVAPNSSLVVLLAGTPMTVADLRPAALRFGPDVRVIGIRAAGGAAPAARRIGQMAVLTVPTLDDLAAAIRTAVRG